MLSDQLTIDLKPGGRRRPYHQQIYAQVREAILVGRLRPGDRLPATRDLAAQLNLARNTVVRAYEDLLTDGFLTGKAGAGTFVAPEAAPALDSAGVSDGRRVETAAALELTAWGRAASREVPDDPLGAPPPIDFRPGTPDWQAFPRALWLRLLGRALRKEASELTRYGDPAGYFPLREAIARHLALSRGVVARPEQVVIVGGSQQALDLLARLAVSPGDAVAVEEPGYPEARRVFAAAGARLVTVPVDAEGMRVEELAPLAGTQTPRLLYVTPSHQFPTGVTLPLGRRLALLDWAERARVLVVEDDYDSEFHYGQRPVASLQGLAREGRVAYVGTFSTVLFPPLRVGYVVLPPQLVRPFVKAKWLADRQTPMLEQLALADFLDEGHFARHLRRMRRLAAERRAALLAAVGESFGERASVPAAGTGMHVMLLFRLPKSAAGRPGRFEARLVARAAALGVGVYPVASCRASSSDEAAVLLGYAALPPERIREGVRRLARAFDEIAG